MNTSCTPLKANCGSPVPDGLCCMTIKNLTSHILHVTQYIASPIVPLCFDVAASSDLAIQVKAPSLWTITDSVTRVVYHKSIGPDTGDKTYLVLIDGTEPGNLISPDAQPVPNSKFFLLAAAFVIFGGVGSYVLKKHSKPTADFLECMQLMDKNATLCSQLHPQPKTYLTFGKVALVCAALVILAWFLLKGPLGKLLAGEPTATINCVNCNKRGGGWQFRAPSAQDGVTGWKLKLRQLRCQFGQKDGPCMCANQQARATCLKVAQDPRAPKKLTWQADVGNIDYTNKNAPNKPPVIPWDICACCTARDPGPKDQCFDVTVSDPLTVGCRNN